MVSVWAAEPVAIPDTALRAAIIDTLDLEQGHSLTTDDMARLSELRERGARIARLDGLEAAVNLERLDLRDNAIVDLKPIAGLQALRYLNINLNPYIESVEPLRGLNNLEVLLMREVPVLGSAEEQAVLAKLGGLDRLNARATGLTSVGVLLPGLANGGYRVQLDIQENPITDYERVMPFIPALDDFARPGPRVSGRARSSMGIAVGLLDSEFLQTAWIYDLDIRLEVEAAPSDRTRVTARLEADIDTEAVEIELPIIDRLYLDVAPMEPLLLRVGRQSLDWGSGHLFEDATDLMQNVDDGYALRLDVPLGLLQTTSVVATRAGYAADDSLPGSDEAAYALRIGVPLGLVELGMAGWYRHAAIHPLRTNLQAVAAGFGLELAVSATAAWDTGEWPEGDGWVTSTLVWQPGDSGWRITAEHEYDSTAAAAGGHFAGIELESAQFGGFSGELSYLTAFFDGSEYIELALEQAFTPWLFGVLRVPAAIGEPDTYFGENTTADMAAALSAGIDVEVKF